jgi:hypothetical protein
MFSGSIRVALHTRESYTAAKMEELDSLISTRIRTQENEEDWNVKSDT